MYYTPPTFDFDAAKLMQDVVALKKVIKQQDKKIEALEERLVQSEAGKHTPGNNDTPLENNEQSPDEQLLYMLQFFEFILPTADG
ncbi:hypothetical protein MAR_009781 [Mya arenaria]|uniref:Uncharacterized protein n=1 Tax=Mya arenaria TaxID=6604 RepID=A0ABY7DZR4_MYAAR|nr:hypothetical protein MAR_009781 [Mya arenaria]